MPAPSYENVQPLVESIDSSDGMRFEYTFRCPETGFKATGTATAPEPDSPESKSRLKEELGSSMGLAAARDRIARRVPGGEQMADLAEGVFGWRRGRRSQERAVAEGKARSEGLEQQLAVEAFETVADQFEWDAKGERWVKAGG